MYLYNVHRAYNSRRCYSHSQMKEGSVYNLIDKLDPKDLKYLSSDNIQVDVCDKAKEVLNHASTWKKERKGT